MEGLKVRTLTEEECVPAPLALAVSVEMDECPVSDEQAVVALRSVGAETTPEAVHAIQTIGVWATKLKLPQILLARQFTSLEQVDKAKQLASTLLEASSGGNEMSSIQDPEMAVHAIKSMATILAVEEKIHRSLLEFHEKSQPEKLDVGGRNRLRPISLHVHQAQTA
jgi:hypothetical protein